MKKCPFCAEEIQDEAVVCRFCGRDLKEPEPEKKPDRLDPYAIHPIKKEAAAAKSNSGPIAGVVIAILIMILCVGFAMLSNREPDPPAATGSKSMAWVMCEKFVKDQLKAPSTAKFVNYSSDRVTELGDEEYRVKMDVDAENSFGAMIRSEFTCRVKYKGNDTWGLIDLYEN